MCPQRPAGLLHAIHFIYHDEIRQRTACRGPAGPLRRVNPLQIDTKSGYIQGVAVTHATGADYVRS